MNVGEILLSLWNDSGFNAIISGFMAEDGSLLFHGRFDTVTVWAKARETGEGEYELLDVYSHRMRVERGGV